MTSEPNMASGWFMTLWTSMTSFTSNLTIPWATLGPGFWGAAAGCLFLVWVTYSIIYAFYLSPLRHFPGPKLWAISRIPSNLSVIRGHNHLDILALHKEYGPILRLGPNELAFNTAEAFRDIYGARPGGCFPKNRSHYIAPANGVDHLVCAVDHATHARHKRLLAHAFSEKALRDQEGLITGGYPTSISRVG
ncbi:hypothetical protein ACN38_g1098 [Penicillium nordicum]|uniref:Uncharacterized protein n=1 Tax=Penicillium nordicum TaxID=229535 RepID=A0A0M8P9E3_9EURO|nr:hypothetical protein ACN38_g1098 [Penicillium nordicum]